MKDYLQRPIIMEEAKQSSEGHNWFVELLIFGLVFIIINIPIGIISAIGMIAYMVSDAEYMSLLTGGSADTQRITEITTNLMTNIPEWIIIMLLFCEAFMIVGAFIYCRKIEGRKLRTLGFVKNKFLTEYAKGLFIGFLIFALAVLIGVLTGSLKITGISATFSIGFVAFYFVGYMIQGMAEEVMTRGYLMVSISRRYSIPIAILLSSLVFAALHLGNSGVTALSILNLVLFGTFAAVVMIKNGNIWIVAGVHSMWNFAQGNIFGIQVSGMNKQNSILNTNMVDGKSLVNGGAFGLEGGLAVTIVLLAGIAFVLYRSKISVNETSTENVMMPENQAISEYAAVTQNVVVEAIPVSVAVSVPVAESVSISESVAESTAE